MKEKFTTKLQKKNQDKNIVAFDPRLRIRICFTQEILYSTGVNLQSNKTKVTLAHTNAKEKGYLVHLIRTTNRNLEFLQQIFVYLLCQ